MRAKAASDRPLLHRFITPPNQRADGGAIEAENEISFPMPRHYAVLRLGWKLSHEDLGSDNDLPRPRLRARSALRVRRHCINSRFSASRPWT